jgi:hypothetical protein
MVFSSFFCLVASIFAAHAGMFTETPAQAEKYQTIAEFLWIVAISCNTSIDVAFSAMFIVGYPSLSC